jgi:hypothetical protein
VIIGNGARVGLDGPYHLAGQNSQYAEGISRRCRSCWDIGPSLYGGDPHRACDRVLTQGRRALPRTLGGQAPHAGDRDAASDASDAESRHPDQDGSGGLRRM